MYIYATQNLINGKIYVGQSKRDIIESADYYGSGCIINAAIKKYGKNNFTKIILVKNIDSEEIMNKLEIYYIKLLDSRDRNIGYNIAEGGTGGNTGGMKEETRIRKSTVKENGLTEFQEWSIKAQKTMKANGSDIIRIEKTKETMSMVNEDGLNKYQINGKKQSENWKNMTEEEKEERGNIISNSWKNKSESEMNEFRKMRSVLAKSQRQNETEEMKQYRREIICATYAAGISTYNIKTGICKRLNEEEFNNKVLIAGAGAKYITKATTADNKEIYLYNPNSYKRFAREFNCSENWVKGLSSNGKKYTTPYTKFKHLEGIIRERIQISDITDDIIDNIEKNNYI